MCYSINIYFGTNFKSIIIALLLLNVDFIAAEDEIVVKIETGKIKGVRIENHLEFRKIPYAKPPVESLRFKVNSHIMGLEQLFKTFS